VVRHESRVEAQRSAARPHESAPKPDLTRAVEFRDAEEAYFRWLEAHPGGFVINTRVSRSAGYMMLHRATCRWIREYVKGTAPGGFTERDYIKVCAQDIESLRAWVMKHGRPDGTFSGECGFCKPR
jgi:hypothetical protein